MLFAALTVGAAAFVANVPLGMWREGTRKFSWRWFVAVHLSVPLVIALRVAAELPATLVPLFILLAIAGQVVGSRARRRWMEAVAPLAQRAIPVEVHEGS